MDSIKEMIKKFNETMFSKYSDFFKNSNIASSDFSYFGKDSEIEEENKTIGTPISSLAIKKLPQFVQCKNTSYFDKPL